MSKCVGSTPRSFPASPALAAADRGHTPRPALPSGLPHMPDFALLRLLPRFRDAYRALHALEERERWSRPQIEALQLERLTAVWASARARVRHYRDLGDRLPPRFTSLAEFSALVPTLDRATVHRDPLRLLADR